MKTILITMGDPGGVGPEIIARALGEARVRKCCAPIVIGDALIMERAFRLVGIPWKLRVISSPEEAVRRSNWVDVIHVPCERAAAPVSGRPDAAGGAASARYIMTAVGLMMERRAAALVTAPISKEALHMAGFPWPGHTEMLAELSGTRNFAMMLVGGPLRVVLATTHAALKDVPSLITRGRILRVIRLAHKACAMFGISSPKIGVAGLNPHAGEGGLFGTEERTIIGPAVRRAIKEGIPVSGPHPPDSLFHKAYRSEFDIVVCMYHDQGLIPLKMVAFETGVNVTVGLPFVRTSPDHGTAYDIAWTGKADPSSLVEAIKLAIQLEVDLS